MIYGIFSAIVLAIVLWVFYITFIGVGVVGIYVAELTGKIKRGIKKRVK